jgi:2-polyprenyl-3-methyl-5-hydroxy-6-metoxy-1,4-benzoquinol methylase
MNKERNFNRETRDTPDHKYAYGFDFHVMHDFMLRSFSTFFREGNMLELGSYQGDFTQKLLRFFNDITCVEGSVDAIRSSQKSIGDKVKYVHSSFESVKLPTTYDHIVMTHVLEHTDDPIAILKKARQDWLSERGRLFVACPNANAPSRQIAVRMGLVSHTTAVTDSEKQHGHRRTYTLETLENDAVKAGLRVVHRSGIFFKAFANFQWDRLLQTDIVSKDYLEGCYQIGQVYPDLCASIFLVCEKATFNRQSSSE